jgi:hypothetical protein
MDKRDVNGPIDGLVTMRGHMAVFLADLGGNGNSRAMVDDREG